SILFDPWMARANDRRRNDPYHRRGSCRWIRSLVFRSSMSARTRCSAVVSGGVSNSMSASYLLSSIMTDSSTHQDGLLLSITHSRRVAAQVAEERTYVLGEQVRLLHRGEVSAAAVLRPVHDVVFPFGEPPHGQRDVAPEHGHAGGRRGRLVVRRRGGVEPLVVEAGRRTRGPGGPGQRYVGEKAVSGNRVLGYVGRVRPLLELLDDPRQLTDG